MADKRSWRHVVLTKSRRTSIRQVMTPSANPGIWAAKNTGDHKKFRQSCAPQRRFRTAPSSCCQTRHPTNAIIKYRAVQTGPNIQLGGLKNGFCRLAYHAPGVVMIPIAMPPPITRSRNKANVVSFFMVFDSSF